MALWAVTVSCYRMRKSKGGGEVAYTQATRSTDTADIALMPGYRIEAVASGLDFPTAVAFDDNNNMYVLESGYSYGEVFLQPALSRLTGDGKKVPVIKGSKNGPWTGVSYHSGRFYIAEGGVMDGGSILRVAIDGSADTLISRLPSKGDHHVNGPAVRDGFVYFGIGVATNSAVVGQDNADFGWLQRAPDFADIPCEDIILTGENFETNNVLPGAGKKMTGAYVPFGTSTTEGQVIKGRLPCTGSVLRVPITGGDPQLVAWGFRNPFGLGFSPDGKLFVTDNGFDERGSRPVWGAGDVLWQVNEGQWFGWPDFSAGKAVWNDEEFHSPGKKKLNALLKIHPSKVPAPVANMGVHSSSNGFDFSTSDAFGLRGEVFVAQFGDMAPGAGKVLYPVGFKVVRVDTRTGVIRDFIVNKGKRNGPASWLRNHGIERPVAVKFSPSGDAMYVVDFGVLTMNGKKAEPRPGTGVIWKVTKI